MVTPVQSPRPHHSVKDCPECGRTCNRDSMMCLACRRARQQENRDVDRALRNAATAKKEAEAAAEDAEFAERINWDGLTVRDVTDTLLRAYETRCLLCGRGDFYHLPEKRALDIARAGLPRCVHCGGFVALDRADIGSLNSTIDGLNYRSRQADTRRRTGGG